MLRGQLEFQRMRTTWSVGSKLYSPLLPPYLAKEPMRKRPVPFRENSRTK